MRNHKTILTGLLSTAFKLDNGQIVELLQDDNQETTDDAVLQLLLTQDQERVKKLLGADTGKFQEGYKKGKKESLEELEKAARDAYKIESEKTGLELIKEIVAENAKAAGKKGEITEDDVKKHEAYLALDRKYKDDMKAKDDEYTSKINEFETKRKQDEVRNTVIAKAKTILNELEPELPSDETVKQNQLNWFFDGLANGKYEVKDTGQVVLLDDEGRVRVDLHGNILEFKDHVKEKATSHFVFKTGNGGQSPQNQGKGVTGEDKGKNKYPEGIVKPKTEEEMWKVVNDTSIPADKRHEVMSAWQAENSK